MRWKSSREWLSGPQSPCEYSRWTKNSRRKRFVKFLSSRINPSRRCSVSIVMLPNLAGLVARKENHAPRTFRISLEHFWDLLSRILAVIKQSPKFGQACSRFAERAAFSPAAHNLSKGGNRLPSSAGAGGATSRESPRTLSACVCVEGRDDAGYRFAQPRANVSSQPFRELPGRARREA